MVKVKICGITRLQDALDACDAGVDALGLVFYPQSPRYIDPEKAALLIEALPPFVSTVGLFVNSEAEQVRAVIQATQIDLLQFHGDEDEAFCRQFSRPYIKAIRMAPALDLNKEIAKFASARGILLDAYDPQRYGGTGRVFDWRRVPNQGEDRPSQGEDNSSPAAAQAGLGKPIIVAGGLSPNNVAEAIRTLRPWGVDVSGGVEQSKGIKDRTLIEAFVRGAKSVQ